MFLTPRWIASHVFVVLLVAACIGAGMWQLDRLDQRRSDNARIEARMGRAVDLVDLAADDEELEFTRVSVTGSYDPDRSRDIVVGNRVANGGPGFWMWSVFDASDGSELIVNRGFAGRATVLRDEGGLAPPSGPVQLVGRLRKGIGGGSLSSDGEEVSRPDAALVAGDRAVASRFEPSIYLELIAQEPAEVPDIEPVPSPDLGDGPHLSYAFQWFTFATIGTVGYGLILRRIGRGDAARGDIPY